MSSLQSYEITVKISTQSDSEIKSYSMIHLTVLDCRLAGPPLASEFVAPHPIVHSPRNFCHRINILWITLELNFNGRSLSNHDLLKIWQHSSLQRLHQSLEFFSQLPITITHPSLAQIPSYWTLFRISRRVLHDSALWSPIWPLLEFSYLLGQLGTLKTFQTTPNFTYELWLVLPAF